jgi:hypothetical protein
MLKMHINDMQEAQEEQKKWYSPNQEKTQEELDKDKVSKKSKSVGNLVIKDHNSEWDVSSEDDSNDSDDMDDEQRAEAQLEDEAEAIADIVLNDEAKT